MSKLNLDYSRIKDKIKLCESGKCPTCGKDFDSSELSLYLTERDNIERAIAESEIEQNELLSRQADIAQQREAENKKQSRYDLLEEKISNEIESIKKAKNNLEEKEKTIEIIFNKDIASIEVKIENNREKITKNLNNIKNNEEEILILNGKKEKIEKIDKPVLDKDILSKISNLETIIKNYEKVESLNEKIKENNDKIEIEKSKDNIEKDYLTNKKEELIQDIEDLKKGKNILQKEFPNYVISQLTSDLERNINSFLEKTYDKFQLKIEDKKDSIYILYGPEKKDVKLASGYERQIFNLATKYGIGKIQDLKLLIVDEIDSQGDLDNSLKMYNLLGNLSDIYSQIFIITHKADVQELLCSNYNAVNFEFYNGEVQ